MATYTSNLNLYMPDSTDDFGEFREEHNDNMVKIDNAIGGGGGSGGHTIIDQSGNAMPSRTGLQFIGASVTDDSVNNKTVVTVTGGGGGVHYSTSEQVIGTFFDKPLYQKSWDLASGIPVSYNGWTGTSIDSTNMESIVSVKATHPDGTCYEGIMADPTRQSHTVVGLQTTRNGNDARIQYLTLQYTKVTD